MAVCCCLCDFCNRWRDPHNTHLASFLLQFIHGSVCDAKSVQLQIHILGVVLEAVNATLYELHVILSESASLVCEDVLDLQAV